MSFFSTVANVYGWHLSLGFVCPSARISHSKTDQQVASTSWVCPKMGSIPTIGAPLYHETYNSGCFCINTNLETAVKQPKNRSTSCPNSVAIARSTCTTTPATSRPRVQRTLRSSLRRRRRWSKNWASTSRQVGWVQLVFFSFSGRRQARYLVMLWMTCQTPPFPVFDTPSKTCLGKGCYTRTQFPGAPNGNRAHLYERESDSGDLWVSEQLWGHEDILSLQQEQHPAWCLQAETSE